MICFMCKGSVSAEEWEIVKGKDPSVTWAAGVVACEACADDIHDGAEEAELRHAQQAMIVEALTFIGDYGAEAWNEVVTAVCEQAK